MDLKFSLIKRTKYVVTFNIKAIGANFNAENGGYEIFI
jgi:hypothetical protein